MQLIDHLPDLTERVERDVLPVMATLGTVAPDIHDLLDVSRELNEMLAKLPGHRAGSSAGSTSSRGRGRPTSATVRDDRGSPQVSGLLPGRSAAASSVRERKPRLR